MKRTIETERLIIRPIEVDDAQAAFVWLSDPRVNRYMPYPLYTDVDQAIEWISALKEESNEFVFVLKDSGLVIGAGSIKPQENRLWEVGYQLRYDYWNKGYTTEAAKAMIKWAYDYCNAREFMARHATANVASGKVLQKCGYKFDRYGKYSRYDGSETFEATYYKMSIK